MCIKIYDLSIAKKGKTWWYNNNGILGDRFTESEATEEDEARDIYAKFQVLR